MKNALLLSLLLSVVPAAAFAADLAVEPTAAPVVSSGGDYSGYVEGYALGGTLYDGYDVYGFGVSGALAYKLDSNWQIEAEFGAETFTGTDDYDYSDNYGFAALHANYYTGDFAVGAFGGLASIGADYYGYYAGFGGVEGQASLSSDIVVNAQLGYIGGFDGYAYDDGYELKAWFGQASIAWFPTENIELSATLGASTGEYYYWWDDDFTLVTATLEGAYQFENSPLSLFASYSYTDESGEGEYDNSTLKIGARFSFDGESLKSQATTGASHKVDLSALAYHTW